MKKAIPLVALVVAALVGVYSWRKTPARPEADATTPASASAGLKNEQASYTVHLTVQQRKEGAALPILEFNASLQQNWNAQGAAECLSEWSSIEGLTMMGQAVQQSQLQTLRNQAILSVYDAKEQNFVHYLPKDFPAQYVPFQLGLLHKIILPFTREQLQVGVVARSETDEVGGYKAEYTIKKIAEGFDVSKKWLYYNSQAMKVDGEANAIDYTLAEDGRLVGAKGRVTIHYRQGESAHYTTEFNVGLTGRRLVASKALKREAMKPSDFKQIAQDMAANDPNHMSFEEAMKTLDSIDEKTDSSEVYRVFSNLKAEVIKDPAKAGQLFEKINRTSSRDPSSKRQLTAVFGALAQSEDTAIAESLATLATSPQCADSFCKVQAIVGLSDHPFPSELTAEKMLEIGRSSPDLEIAGTALLAAGSVGRKLDTSLPELPKALIAELNNPAKAPIKSTVLAAMGNHGNGDYLTSLESYAKSAKDVSLQASAVYSLRYLPQESVNATLLSVLSQSKDKNVMSEAIKAIQYRNFSPEQYQSLARTSGALSDKDLAQAAARLLVQAYRDDPKLDAPVQTLRDETRVQGVKDYLNGEIKRIEEAQNAGTGNRQP